MMNKKKILIIIPNLGKGGAQRVFHQQMKHLSYLFDVKGCVFNWDGSFEEDRLENIFSLEIPAGNHLISKAYYFILRIIKLRKFKKLKGTNVSISHLEGADYVNILSRSTDKTICWIHGTKEFDQNISGSLGWLRKKILIPLIYKRANKLASVSEALRRELTVHFKIEAEKVVTIFNGFDLQNIDALIKEPLTSNVLSLMKNKTLITHCRLAAQKNLIGLLYVFSHLKNRLKIKLIILGDGELRDDLINASLTLKLNVFHTWGSLPWSEDYDVYFLGHQANPYPYLRQATLYVMSSDWEGFPLALCEAMACGTPVVSADCRTGPREILEKDKRKFGTLLPLLDSSNPDSIKLWSNEISEKIEDKQSLEHFRIVGRERVLNFKLEENIKKTINLIQTVLVEISD